MAGIHLYGAPASLYTAKVRSFLTARRIPFEERFPSHRRYREVIRPAVESHRIPVVEFDDGLIVQDSTLILDELERRHPDPVAATMGPRQKLLTLLLESVGDRALAKPAMHFRWSFPDENQAFIVGEFGRSLAFPASDEEVERKGRRVAAKMSGYLPMLGISERTIPAIEAAYAETLSLLNAHFAEHPYLLGGAPTRGDFALMGPLFGHLGRDPYPLQIMQKRAPLVFRWTERVNWGELSTPEFPDRPRALVAHDAVPATLASWLRHVFHGGFVEELQATADRLRAWVEANPDAGPGTLVSPEGVDQPSLGPIVVRYHGLAVEQQALGHSLWLLQRVLDFLEGLAPPERSAAEALLGDLGAGGLAEVRLACRLTRVRNRLAVA